MTWNLQGNPGPLDSQVNLMVEKNPDIVMIQELPDGYLEQYRSQLQARTGVQWWARQGCEASGDNAGCDGTAMFSRRQPLSQDSRWVSDSQWHGGSNRYAVRFEVMVGTRRVNIWATHLDWYYNQDPDLMVGAENLMRWTSEFGGPKIVGGDFNSWHWGTDGQKWVLNLIRSNYGFTDTCVERYGSDDSCPHTNFFDGGSWRPDAIYRSSEVATELSTFNIDDRGTWYSDHKPIFVKLRVP